MLEDLLKSPVTRRRLCTGLVADHIEAFADWLQRHGYTPITIELRLRSLVAWADWLQTAGFTANDYLSGFEAFKAALGRERVSDEPVIMQSRLAMIER